MNLFFILLKQKGKLAKKSREKKVRRFSLTQRKTQGSSYKRVIFDYYFILFVFINFTVL